MAYLGTTAASSISNPPALFERPLSGGARIATTEPVMGMGLWMFASTDTTSSPFTSGYFSDAKSLGMKQGDVVICVGMTSTVTSSQVLMLGCVSSISTAGASQLSTFSFISST